MSAGKSNLSSSQWKTPVQRYKNFTMLGNVIDQRVSNTIASAAPTCFMRSASETLLSSSNTEFHTSTPKRGSNNPFKRRISLNTFQQRTSTKGKENVNPNDSESSCDQSPISHSIFDDIERNVAVNQKKKFCKFEPLDFSTFHQLSDSNEKDTMTHDITQLPQISSAELINDERLGTAINVVSLAPFSWMQDRQPGNFLIRNSGKDIDIAAKYSLGLGCISIECMKQPGDVYSPLQLLLASTIYWQYPEIAWIKLFPRIRQHNLYSRKLADSWPLCSSKCMHSVKEQWNQSFEHLYSSWRKSNRRSFYVCCANFTLLFTSKHGSHTNSRNFQIFIYPQSMTLQQLLMNEEIKYESVAKQNERKSFNHSLVFKFSDKDGSLASTDDQTSSSIKSHSKSNVQESDGESDSSDESKTLILNDAWLLDIGVSPTSTAKHKQRSYSLESLEKLERDHSSTFALRVNCFQNGDQNLQIVVSDPVSMQALFNLIMEGRIGWATAGPQAGLPPTLLSSQPFLFSAMKTLSKSSHARKEGEDFIHTLTLKNGPIMPHMLPMLHDYLKSCKCLKKTGNQIHVNILGREAYPSSNINDESGAAKSDFTEFKILASSFSGSDS